MLESCEQNNEHLVSLRGKARHGQLGDINAIQRALLCLVVTLPNSILQLRKATQ
jgi:hypothetical protein